MSAILDVQVLQQHPQKKNNNFSHTALWCKMGNISPLPRLNCYETLAYLVIDSTHRSITNFHRTTWLCVYPHLTAENVFRSLVLASFRPHWLKHLGEPLSAAVKYHITGRRRDIWAVQFLGRRLSGWKTLQHDTELSPPPYRGAGGKQPSHQVHSGSVLLRWRPIKLPHLPLNGAALQISSSYQWLSVQFFFCG